MSRSHEATPQFGPSTSISCVICEHDRAARQDLARLVEQTPDLTIMAVEADPGRLFPLIERDAPDVIFFNPSAGSTTELSRLLEQRHLQSLVVLLFARETAIPETQTGSVAYVLRTPINDLDFQHVVSAIKARIIANRLWHATERLVALLKREDRARHNSQRMAIRAGGQIIFLRVEDIDWIEARGNYLRIHSGKEVHQTRETMIAMEAKLDPSHFVRIHRSAIVNVDRIKSIEPWPTGEYVVRLEDGKELTLTRSFHRKVFWLLGKSESA